MEEEKEEVSVGSLSVCCFEFGLFVRRGIGIGSESNFNSYFFQFFCVYFKENHIKTVTVGASVWASHKFERYVANYYQLYSATYFVIKEER